MSPDKAKNGKTIKLQQSPSITYKTSGYTIVIAIIEKLKGTQKMKI